MEEEINLKDLFLLFWNKKLQIILIIVIMAFVGEIYTTKFVKTTYTASTSLVLATSNDSSTATQGSTITSTDVTLYSKLISTYSEIAKSHKVVRQVISDLGIDMDETELKNNIKVTQKENTEMINISVSNEDPELAAKIANELAKVFSEQVKEYYKMNNIHVVDEAEAENAVSNVNHKKDVIIFTGIGVLIAISYVLLVNLLDTTVKSAEDVEKMFNVPVLVTIPLHDYKLDKKEGRKNK